MLETIGSISIFSLICISVYVVDKIFSYVDRKKR